MSSRASGKAGMARAAIAARRGDFIAVGVFSAALNVLMLTGSFYMLEVYDRVMVSRSVETLIVLSIIAGLAFLLQGALDALRGRMLSRIGARIDIDLAVVGIKAATLLPLRGASPAEALQPSRDAEQLRSFLGSAGPTAFFDMPFLPIFLGGCFLLHPLLGLACVVGGFVIVGLTLATERSVGPRAKEANQTSLARQVYIDSTRRHAEVIAAMGMGPAIRTRWQDLSEEARRGLLRVGDAQGDLGGAARVFRIMLQSGILGLGAYLAIQGEVSPGAMIAASILSSRALAPLEQAIAHWRGFVSARQSLARLDALVLPESAFSVSLPAPRQRLSVEGASLAVPGRSLPVVIDATFELQAGSALAIIGPSGSGKSTLARALVGVLPPWRGTIRLDGASLDQWDSAELGSHIGFMPQELQLFDGTVAETISRFAPDASSEAIIAAARAAGAHEMIVTLSDGYDTRIGEGGAMLSAGQRQRLGLARALYGDPFLVVLDEPNSHLDAPGEEALARAISTVRARGGIAVMVTHRPSALAVVDKVALVMEGRIKLFGPRDEVMRAINDQSNAPRPNRPVPVPVAKSGGAS